MRGKVTYNKTTVTLTQPFRYFAEELDNASLFVAGGYATSLLYPNRVPSDIDVFSCDPEWVVGEVEGLISRWDKQEVLYETEFSTSIKFKAFEYPVNFIKPREAGLGYKTYGLSYELLERFDFVNCCSALSFYNGEAVVLSHPELETWEEKNQLKLNNITCPIANLRRAFKYVGKKGYRGLGVKDLVALFERGVDTEQFDESLDWYEQLLRFD